MSKSNEYTRTCDQCGKSVTARSKEDWLVDVEEGYPHDGWYDVVRDGSTSADGTTTEVEADICSPECLLDFAESSRRLEKV